MIKVLSTHKLTTLLKYNKIMAQNKGNVQCTYGYLRIFSKNQFRYVISATTDNELYYLYNYFQHTLFLKVNSKVICKYKTI